MFLYNFFILELFVNVSIKNIVSIDNEVVGNKFIVNELVQLLNKIVFEGRNLDIFDIDILSMEGIFVCINNEDVKVVNVVIL